MEHITVNATPKNPNVPTGAVNFIYEISSVTVDSTSTAGVNKPVVKFRVKSYTGSYSAAAVAAATPVHLCGWRNGDVTRAHMTANGAQIGVKRSTALAASPEQCVLCHGSGRVADVNIVHKK